MMCRTREHWDECPSVFDLWWDMRVREKIVMKNRLCWRACFDLCVLLSKFIGCKAVKADAFFLRFNGKFTM